MLLRPLGNTIYVMPPYCITAAELDLVYDAIAARGGKICVTGRRSARIDRIASCRKTAMHEAAIWLAAAALAVACSLSSRASPPIWTSKFPPPPLDPGQSAPPAKSRCWRAAASGASRACSSMSKASPKWWRVIPAAPRQPPSIPWSAPKPPAMPNRCRSPSIPEVIPSASCCRSISRWRMIPPS